MYYHTSTLFDKKKIIWSDEQLPTSAKQIDASVVIDVSYWRDLLNACVNPDRLYFYEEEQNFLFCCGDASNKGHGFTIFQLSRENFQFNDETRMLMILRYNSTY